MLNPASCFERVEVTKELKWFITSEWMHLIHFIIICQIDNAIFCQICTNKLFNVDNGSKYVFNTWLLWWWSFSCVCCEKTTKKQLTNQGIFFAMNVTGQNCNICLHYYHLFWWFWWITRQLNVIYTKKSFDQDTNISYVEPARLTKQLKCLVF